MKIVSVLLVLKVVDTCFFIFMSSSGVCLVCCVFSRNVDETVSIKDAKCCTTQSMYTRENPFRIRDLLLIYFKAST